PLRHVLHLPPMLLLAWQSNGGGRDVVTVRDWAPGPVPPSHWGPPAHPRHIALWHGPEGDPHARRPDPALLRITPGEVLDALHRLPAPEEPAS
ncbi:hypothetical protein ACWEFQ_29310, partial [Streptomyces albogriseolus]